MDSSNEQFRLGYFFGLIETGRYILDFESWMEDVVNDILKNRVSLTLKEDLINEIVSTYIGDTTVECIDTDTYIIKNDDIEINLKIKVIHNVGFRNVRFDYIEFLD